jgi:hypothetical protein
MTVAAQVFAEGRSDLKTFLAAVRFPARTIEVFEAALAQKDIKVAEDFTFITIEDLLGVATEVHAATPPVMGLLRVALPAVHAAIEDATAVAMQLQ